MYTDMLDEIKQSVISIKCTHSNSEAHEAEDKLHADVLCYIAHSEHNGCSKSHCIKLAKVAIKTLDLPFMRYYAEEPDED